MRRGGCQISTESFMAEDVRKIRRLLDKRGRKSSKLYQNSETDGSININLYNEDVKKGGGEWQISTENFMVEDVRR